MHVAVIGAGLAGLAAATDLARSGHTVTVWEKSRGAGGRTATRRGPDGMRFDHGAPFLHDGAARLGGLAGLADHQLTHPDETTTLESVGDGANNAPAKAFASALDVRTGVRVAIVAPVDGGWALHDDAGTALGTADAVIVAAPAPQAADLLREGAPQLAYLASGVEFDSCWAVMAAWERPLSLPFTAANAVHGLEWAVAEAPKPGRSSGERWVLQADADLSREHLEAEAAAIGPLLLGRFVAACGVSIPPPLHLAAHRWRYSRPATPLDERFLREGTLLAAGDWCGGTTAGAAIRSGRAAAASLIG